MSNKIILCLICVCFFMLSNVSKLFAQTSVHAKNIGAVQCKTCHLKEYQIWSKGPHAKALKNLSSLEKSQQKCKTCHSMQQKGAELTLSAVQCESCHGPGEFYAKNYVMKDKKLREKLFLLTINEHTCLKCHTENSPSLKSFNFQESLKKIKHWQDKQ